MSHPASVIVQHIYADLSRPAEVQAKALELEAHIKRLFQRVRDEVFAIEVDELEVYRDLQHSLNLLAEKRPEAARCPYRSAKAIVDLIVMAHDPVVKQLSVARR